MASTVRLQAPIGQRALLITSLAVPLTGWTLHAVSLHRKLAAARRDPLTGLLVRDGYTAKARQTLARYGDSTLVVLVDLDHFSWTNPGALMRTSKWRRGAVALHAATTAPDTPSVGTQTLATETGRDSRAVDLAECLRTILVTVCNGEWVMPKSFGRRASRAESPRPR
ncbi:hypothetical protein [Streptomyces sp. NBC_00853]|uniref:hypothetical protein n=1 Tax=Streptomyces sp. NBC_00853 TaxID=2903681 RepID=UPI003872AB44